MFPLLRDRRGMTTAELLVLLGLVLAAVVGVVLVVERGVAIKGDDVGSQIASGSSGGGGGATGDLGLSPAAPSADTPSGSGEGVSGWLAAAWDALRGVVEPLPDVPPAVQSPPPTM